MKPLILAAALTLSAGAALAADGDAVYGTHYPDLQGKPTALATLRGKPAVVNFWARWCAPCRQEIPELNALAARAGDRLAVVGIALEDHSANAIDFARAYEIAYPVAFAGAGGGIALMKALGNELGGLPFTVVLDAEGQVVYRKTGLLKPEDLAEATAGLP